MYVPFLFKDLKDSLPIPYTDTPQLILLILPDVFPNVFSATMSRLRMKFQSLAPVMDNLLLYILQLNWRKINNNKAKQ